MMFDDHNRVTVGTPGFSDGAANYMVIQLDSHGTPFVAYQDAAHDNKATVMTFDGTDRVAVGTPGFSDGGINPYSISLVLDSHEYPVVAYNDNVYQKAVVKQWNGEGRKYI